MNRLGLWLTAVNPATVPPSHPANKRHSPGLLLVLVICCLGLTPLPLRAEQGQPRQILRAGGEGLTTAEEERDARGIADRVNEALNLRREVTITLCNDTTVVVNGRMTVQRYWLVITAHDGSEFRFRAALVATVRIK